jgi:cytochrome c oxidase assembly protein subunit 15
VVLVAVTVALQMLLGGLVSSHYAGLACAYFPTCDGVSIAPSLTGVVGLHVLHRLNGFLLLVAVAALSWMTARDSRLGFFAFLGLRLVLLQIFVGVMNVLLRLPFAITALHSAVAAAIVLTTALLVREVVRARGGRAAVRSSSPGARVAEAS